MSDEQIEKVSDGRYWLAEEALNLNLIDEITDFESAINSTVANSNKSTDTLKKRVKLI